MNVPLAGAGAQTAHITALKKKVTIAACAAFIAGLISQVLIYMAEIRTINEVIQAINEEIPDAELDTQGAGLQVGPGMIFLMIPAALLLCMVPACGFFGARNNHKDLVCLFSGCSGYQSCCGCCNLCTSVLIVVLLGFFLSAAEPMFEACDASVKCPLTEGKAANDMGLVDDLHSVDCLAASVWQGDSLFGDKYDRVYPDFGEIMGTECPSVVFLNCTSGRTGDDPFDLSSPPSPLMSSHARAHTAAIQMIRDNSRSPASFHVRRLLSHASTLQSRISRTFTGVKARQDPYDPNYPETIPTMPDDPLHECWADKSAIDGFHALQTILPEIWGTMRTLLWVANACMFVSIVISAFGCIYGQQLYHAYGQQLYQNQGGYMTGGVQPAYANGGQQPMPSSAGTVVTAVQPAYASQGVQPTYANPGVQPAYANPGVVEMNPQQSPRNVELA